MAWRFHKHLIQIILQGLVSKYCLTLFIKFTASLSLSNSLQEENPADALTNTLWKETVFQVLDGLEQRSELAMLGKINITHFFLQKYIILFNMILMYIIICVYI